MGTRSVSSTVKASSSSTVNNVLSDGTKTPTVTLGTSLSATVTDGTAQGQADRAWSRYSTAILSGANEDVDVYDLGTLDIGAGAGKDALGQDWAVAEIVHVLVYNAGPGLLTMSPSSSGGWTALIGASGSVGIKAGGFAQFYAPSDPAFAVTDTSSHQLNFAASGDTCTYDLHLLGRST